MRPGLLHPGYPERGRRRFRYAYIASMRPGLLHPGYPEHVFGLHPEVTGLQ